MTPIERAKMPEAEPLYEHFSVEDIAEMFEFLDGLRNTGVVNMFGAAPYIADNFAIGDGIARKVLTTWIETFSTQEDEK